MHKLIILQLVVFFFLAIGHISAQDFSIKKVEITADQVIVHYDLLDTTRERTYTIHLYSSTDNFLSPLVKISGDVGLEVTPGTNRKIVWNSKEELGASFIGNVELEIRGRVYIPFIQLLGFEDIKDRKRLVPFMVKWTGGSSGNILNFQLYNKENKLIHTFPNAPNEQQYRLTIPRSVKSGNGYYFKITDSKNSDQVIVSSTFAIKPKYPLALKALPLLAIGIGAYMILTSDSNNDISEPPGTPSQKK